MFLWRFCYFNKSLGKKNNEKGDEFTIKISLVTKMVFNVVILICGSIGVFTFMSVKAESKLLTDTLVQATNQKAGQIALGTKNAFYSLNWIFVEKLLQQTKADSHHEVVFVKVVKPNGDVYLADDTIYYGETVAPSFLFEETTLVDNYFLGEPYGNGKLLVHPVKIGEETWYVFLALSLQSVHAAMESLVQRNVRWGGLILLIAISLSFLHSKAISKPLKHLSRSAIAAAKGNLGNTVSVKSSDEVGLLSFVFNRMLNDLKNSSKELEASEKRYRAMVDTASKAEVGIAVIQNNGEQKGLLKYVNQHVCDIFGYSGKELTMMSFMDIVHPESLEEVTKWYTTEPHSKHDHFTYNFIGINKLGENIPIEMTAGTSIFEGRNSVICYIRDITDKLKTAEQLKHYSDNLEHLVEERTAKLQQAIFDLKNTQSQLIQSEKLASIGQLAAGIAHEINTPIQYVGDNTRFLRDTFSDLSTLFEKYEQLAEAPIAGLPVEDIVKDVQATIELVDLIYVREEIPKAIEQTLEGVERVSAIVRSIKEFSHPGDKEKTATDINRAIENTVTLSRNEWKYVAELETDLDPALPLVPCLPGELNQVFLNLIINAAQAVADVVGYDSTCKGIIRISTRKDGDYVEIRISDTGLGIPEEIHSKIFDPFFTTKEVGKGTGQGLAIASSVILEKHGGNLSFKTKVGKGTTFVIRLPIVEIAKCRRGSEKAHFICR